MLKGDSAVRDIQNLPDNGHLYAAHVINDLWRLTDGDAVVVTDVGQHQMWEAQYYKHDKSRSLITSGGLGTMGFALPAAIGAKVARPDAEVWVVVRRRRLPDDDVRAGDDRSGRARRQRGDHQQRVSRDGPAVAGVLLREALRGDAADRARLHQAGAGVRHRRRGGHAAQRGGGRGAGRAGNRGAPRSSTSRSSRRIRCSRWCRPAPICTR